MTAAGQGDVAHERLTVGDSGQLCTIASCIAAIQLAVPMPPAVQVIDIPYAAIERQSGKRY